MFSVERKLRTEWRNGNFKKFRNRLVGGSHVAFSEKI